MPFFEEIMSCILCISQTTKVEQTNERLLAAVKAEKDEAELSLSKERMQTLKLKQELIEAQTRNTDLYKVTLLEFSNMGFKVVHLTAADPM